MRNSYLTGKGLGHCRPFMHMETIMDRPNQTIPKNTLGDNPSMNILDQAFDDDSKETYPICNYDWSKSNCPNCKAEMHLFKDNDKFVWICFDCGTRKPSSVNEALNASTTENYEQSRYHQSKP